MNEMDRKIIHREEEKTCCSFHLSRFFPVLMTITALICLLLFSACAPLGGGPVPGENSPELEELSLYGECRGGEEDQFIIAELRFDRDLHLDSGLEEQIRAVIGGKRIRPEDISAEQIGANEVRLSFHVERVVDGKLKLSRAPGMENIAAITAAEGGNCLADLNVEKIVPSGVTVHETDAGKYVVDSVPTHRSIVWIRLLRDGEILIPEGASGTDIMDQAVAVHEHEFLWATESSVAEDIAETVNLYFGPDITAKAEENVVVLNTANNAGSADLSMEIYEG